MLSAVWLLIILIQLSSICPSRAIKCYGAEAFRWAKEGQPSCQNTYTFFFFEPCWAKCGGISLFPDQDSPDPSGQELCPYRDNGRPGYSDKVDGPFPCNCSRWIPPLPGGACPKCDDFHAIAPMIVATSTNAESAGIKLQSCPPEFDACFGFCTNTGHAHGIHRRGIRSTRCAYGCAKSSSKPVLDLMVATKLSELNARMARDRRNDHPTAILNPAEFKCSAWSFRCTSNLCKDDGCNLASLTSIPDTIDWEFVFVMGLPGVFIFCILFLYLPAAIFHDYQKYQEANGYIPL